MSPELGVLEVGCHDLRSASLGLMEKQPGTSGIFSKDIVCIDRFLDDTLGLREREREKGKEKRKKKINARLIVPGRAVDW